jgi:flavin reductase (DIM6/NTAB) family NADH-FMN oxidoreductase RutF
MSDPRQRWSDVSAPAAERTAGPARALRTVLGRYATGVTVVTTCHGGRPVGVTVNSFTSVSLEPPLVLWCLSRTSGSLGAFVAAPRFVVNVLVAGQEPLARRFAAPGDRFAGTVTDSVDGLPELAGTAATLVCRRRQVLPAGDHLVLFGEVCRATAGDHAPLLFLDGGYESLP